MATVQPKDHLFDGANEQGFIAFYRNLSEKPNTTVRIFDRGEYYTVHGQDAILAAKDLFKTNSVIKYLGGGTKKLESVVLSRLNFESLIRDLLLVKHYRVEIYKSKTGSKGDWDLEIKASPGNLSQVEDVVFGNADQTTTTGVIAVKLGTENGQRVIGVGYIDVGSRVLRVTEFQDGGSFSNLAALLVQLGPRECLLPSGDMGPDGAKLKQVLSRSPLLVSERKRNEFSNKDAGQDLGRLVKEKGSSTIQAQPEMEKVHAISALAAVIKYLELLGDESNFGQYSLSSYDLSQFVRLDTSAARALHLEPQGQDYNASTRSHTILGLVDKCHTPHGHRTMLQWLRQPLVDMNKISERHDLVEAIVSNVELRHSLGEEHLRKVPDLPRMARKLARKNGTLQDLFRLYKCVQRLPNICDAIARYEGEHSTTLSAVFTTPLMELVSDLGKFEEMIETTMDMEQAGLGDFLIKPDFDDTLQELRNTMTELDDQIQNQLRRVAKDLGLDPGKSIKLESNNQLGYFFRITLKEEKGIRNNRAYHILDTNKAGVRFRNSSMQDLNGQYQEARQEYTSQQKAIVDEIMNIASGYAEVIQNLGDVLATLDCIYALASAAVSGPVPYVRPNMLPKGTGKMHLKALRHPCLEVQDEVSFIPNDCSFGQDNGTFHIITGPNMGGKSTFLRSVGVAVIMAQIGSFVAAEEAQISIVDTVLARVGAGDCLLKGVSTFMAEMLETATILRSANSDSLIIIDELGRGTSTYDGFGLAWAISEHIAKELKSYCLFATHFHELTALEDEVPSVKNFHVTATTAHGALTLLYKVKPGPCDRSFGIHVAELANFPTSVIDYAKRKAAELEDDFGDEDDSEDAVKKRKLQREAGEKMIEEFLTKAGALDLKSLSDQQLNEEINKMKDEIKSSQNPYILHLLKNED